MSTSVSKINLILEVIEGSKFSCELKRHLSPRTVGTIIRSLPLKGNAHQIGKNIVYFDKQCKVPMDTPMFIEANTSYAIQMNRGGSSQPYHTSLIRATHPHASNIDQEDVRFCSAFSRDPVACVDQITTHLPIPPSHRWPTKDEKGIGLALSGEP